MAKRNRNAGKKAANARVDARADRLPQNMILIGERVEGDKNIYISQSAYKLIHRFTQGKTTDESGGLLIGSIIEEFGKTNIVICGFVEAKFCEATPTTLKFTHETWEYCHKEIDKTYPGSKIVGWIHTHPGFGIFLSEYDKFIHENFFKEAYEVAYVIDPIQDVEGFYFWIGGKIERCKGFYVFDKVGTKINVDLSDEERPKAAPQQRGGSFSRFVIATLFVVVLALIVSVVILNSRIDALQEQQENIVSIANQNFGTLQQQILSLQNGAAASAAGEAPDVIAYGESSAPVASQAQDDTLAPDAEPDEGVNP